jgi:hypothetical protein
VASAGSRLSVQSGQFGGWDQVDDHARRMFGLNSALVRAAGQDHHPVADHQPPAPARRAAADRSTGAREPGTAGPPWSSPPGAFLATATAASTSPDDLIAITVNELRRLFHALIIEPDRRIADVTTWSIDRCRHQATVKASHYTRQALAEP